MSDRVYRPGQIVEIPESKLSLDIVKSSFTPKLPDPPDGVVDDDAPAPQVVNPEDSALNRDELKRRLESMNVTFKGNASTKELRRLYLEQHELH